MIIQSSYIFLPNPYKKKPAHWKDEKGVIHIETGHTVYSYIYKAFPDSRRERIDDNLFQQSYSISVEINENTVDISIISKNVGESYYVMGINNGSFSYIDISTGKERFVSVPKQAGTSRDLNSAINRLSVLSEAA